MSYLDFKFHVICWFVIYLFKKTTTTTKNRHIRWWQLGSRKEYFVESSEQCIWGQNNMLHTKMIVSGLWLVFILCHWLRSRDILFLPCLFVGLWVCWLDNFNIGHNFESFEIEPLYLACRFLVTRASHLYKNINLQPWSVTYSKEKNFRVRLPSVVKSNNGHNFWSISERPFIFGM